jgi:hypothetical protein
MWTEFSNDGLNLCAFEKWEQIYYFNSSNMLTYGNYLGYKSNLKHFVDKS